MSIKNKNFYGKGKAFFLKFKKVKRWIKARSSALISIFYFAVGAPVRALTRPDAKVWAFAISPSATVYS